MTVKLSRRAALTAAATLPLAATARSVSASASDEMAKAPASHSRSFKLGSFTVTTLLDGSRPVENPKPIFGGGASDAEFAATSAGTTGSAVEDVPSTHGIVATPRWATAINRPTMRTR